VVFCGQGVGGRSLWSLEGQHWFSCLSLLLLVLYRGCPHLGSVGSQAVCPCPSPLISDSIACYFPPLLHHGYRASLFFHIFGGLVPSSSGNSHCLQGLPDRDNVSRALKNCPSPE
jgi:hypothetical protein